MSAPAAALGDPPAGLVAALKPDVNRIGEFSEVLGTFLLIVAAADPTMVDHRFPGSIPLAVQVTAPGMMVAAGCPDRPVLGPLEALICLLEFTMSRSGPFWAVPPAEPAHFRTSPADTTPEGSICATDGG